MENRRRKNRISSSKIPQHLHKIIISLKTGTTIDAEINNLSSIGMNITFTANKIPVASLLSKGDVLDIDFLEIPLHLKGQCVYSYKKRRNIFTAGLFIGTPYYQNKFISFLENQNLGPQLRSPMNRIIQKIL